MAIIFSTVTQAARSAIKHYNGTDDFSITSGKSLNIETSPRGEEIVNETVPAGKVWEVSVTVSIKETDA